MDSDSSDLDQAILATIGYHDILNIPLTATEIWRYLFKKNNAVIAIHRPPFRVDEARQSPALNNNEIASATGRVASQKRAEGNDFREVQKSLLTLAGQGKLQTISGYFFFPGRQDLVEKRLKMHALAQIKWKRLRRIAWFLQAIPFLEMVAASGSLAREFTHKESDLDVLLITKSGRIWTVRFFVTVILDLFHLRRRPTGPTRDLVCLNHYLAQDGLALPYQSLYTALEYAHIVPLIGEGVCKEFREANREWIEKYLVQLLPDEVKNLKQVRKSAVLHCLKRVGEFLLGGATGKALELWLGKRQKEKISKNEENSSAGGRIVASPLHLEFHPHSKEAPLLKKFNLKMIEMSLDQFGAQKDSGLN